MVPRHMGLLCTPTSKGPALPSTEYEAGDHIGALCHSGHARQLKPSTASILWGVNQSIRAWYDSLIYFRRLTQFLQAERLPYIICQLQRTPKAYPGLAICPLHCPRFVCLHISNQIVISSPSQAMPALSALIRALKMASASIVQS